MAWCLMAPSHYPNKRWLIIIAVLRYSPESNFTGNVLDTYPCYKFEITKQVGISSFVNRGLCCYFPYKHAIIKGDVLTQQNNRRDLFLAQTLNQLRCFPTPLFAYFSNPQQCKQLLNSIDFSKQLANPKTWCHYQLELNQNWNQCCRVPI